MPDLFDLLARRWKQVLLVVLLSLVTAAILVYTKRSQYLSMSTAVPTSSYSADKSKVYNQNLELLYSSLGTTDDLDMIVGTGQLDTVYLAVTDEFNLYDHYQVSEKGEAARTKATSILKKNSKVMKSEYGELKVKVWDTDKNLAPQLANSIMNTLQRIHQDLQSMTNEKTLEGLKSEKMRAQKELDSMNFVMITAIMTKPQSDLFNARLKALNDQMSETEKLIGQYEMMMRNKPPVLLVVEKARVAAWPDRPKRIQVLIITAVLSFFFGLLLAVAVDKREKTTA